MGIYLDANVLWGWRSFAEADRLAVSIVARQLSQEVFIPWVAAREAEESYRRSLEDVVAGMESAHALVERRFGAEFALVLEPWPDSESSVALWHRRLTEVATILPPHDEDLRAAWDREITGTPPAKPREPSKPGRGGRDAAVWLGVVRHHRSSGEVGHFLCKDRGDFSDGQGGLHARLAEDLSGPHELHLYSSIPAFLARLGTPGAGRTITLDELHDQAGSVIRSGLKDSLEIPHAVWSKLKPELRYSTDITDLRPVEILDQRRYEQGDDAVVVIDARWEMTVEACYQDRETQTPQMWNAIQDVDATGSVQVFLEERAGESSAQFIGAQMTSDTHLFFHAHGSVVALKAVHDL